MEEGKRKKEIEKKKGEHEQYFYYWDVFLKNVVNPHLHCIPASCRFPASSHLTYGAPDFLKNK